VLPCLVLERAYLEQSSVPRPGIHQNHLEHFINTCSLSPSLDEMNPYICRVKFFSVCVCVCVSVCKRPLMDTNVQFRSMRTSSEPKEGLSVWRKRLPWELGEEGAGGD
jgi:hypothetical protein